MNRKPRPFSALNGLWLALAWGALGSVPAAAATASAPGFVVHRASGEIRIDGALDDVGWRDAARLDAWFETNPGDNVPPPAANVAYLAYDERFFYVGLELADPDPSQIRAPLSDRDNVPPYTDYAGVILDTRNDGKTAMMFLANARGIQYDAISSDSSGEDSAPDFFWDSAARITERGWELELRIPFTSLRYELPEDGGALTWGIILYRNYPREFRYQFFTNQMPRGSSCFICHSARLEGLEGLPRAGGLVVAPYLSGARTDEAETAGEPLDAGDPTGDVGLDVKWTPSPGLALDATFNPDFSQVESDVAQVGANERFALFFPEKRPFFLEGVELLRTPIQAVYTRTLTAPRWGTRATGTLAGSAYTALIAQDEGGGQVVLPGSNDSDLADQDFRSWVGMARVRHDIGEGSFVSALVADREVEGGGYNRVFGPDFEWRLNDADRVIGQFLLSRTRTPDRPDLADEWDGRDLNGHAFEGWWQHNTSKEDWFLDYQDFGDDFRADTGFVPQVGYRKGYGELGYTFRPESGPVRRLRTFAIAYTTHDRGGDLIERQYSTGFGLNARFNTFFRMQYANDRLRAGDVTIPRQQLHVILETSPSRLVSYVYVYGIFGQEVDFSGARPGHGLRFNYAANLRLTDHLELRWDGQWRRLDVDADGARQRLFTASAERLRATYNFTSKAFARVIAQHVETRRDTSLYADDDVDAHDEQFGVTALLAYKLNWQTVLFLGYGDDRELSQLDRLRPLDRQLFAKISYAFSR